MCTGFEVGGATEVSSVVVCKRGVDWYMVIFVWAELWFLYCSEDRHSELLWNVSKNCLLIVASYQGLFVSVSEEQTIRTSVS